MANIRESMQNGGIVLTEEEKRRIAEITKNSSQESIQTAVTKLVIEEKTKEVEEKNAQEQNKFVIKPFPINGDTYQQKRVDEIVKKEQEKLEER